MKAETDAALAAAEAAWPQQRTHKIGKVPPNPATPYNIVSADSGRPRNYRRASRASSNFHRLSVQSVGASHDEAVFAVEKALLAFLDKRLTIAGKQTTPLRIETPADIQRDPDGGVMFYALQTFTFTTPA